MAKSAESKLPFSCTLEAGIIDAIRVHAKEHDISQAVTVTRAIKKLVGSAGGYNADHTQGDSNPHVAFWQQQLEAKDRQISELQKHVGQAQHLAAMYGPKRLISPMAASTAAPTPNPHEVDEDDAYDPPTPDEEVIRRDFESGGVATTAAPSQTEAIEIAVRAAMEEQLANFTAGLETGKKKKGKKGKKGKKK